MAQLHEFVQYRRWNISNLLIPVVCSLNEFEHILDSLLRNRVRVILSRNFFGNGSKHRQSRIEFTLLSLFDYDPEQFPNVVQRFEIVAPIAKYVRHFYQPEAL